MTAPTASVAQALRRSSPIVRSIPAIISGNITPRSFTDVSMKAWFTAAMPERRMSRLGCRAFTVRTSARAASIVSETSEGRLRGRSSETLTPVVALSRESRLPTRIGSVVASWRARARTASSMGPSGTMASTLRSSPAAPSAVARRKLVIESTRAAKGRVVAAVDSSRTASSASPSKTEPRSLFTTKSTLSVFLNVLSRRSKAASPVSSREKKTR